MVAFLATAAAAVRLPAQEPAPAPPPAPSPAPAPTAASPTAAERLAALLQELRGLDPKAWTERLAKLEREAAEHERTAVARRAEAQKLEQQAATADVAAKAVRDEMQKLLELQKLLATLPGAPATPPAPTPPTPAPKPDGKDAPAQQPVSPPAPAPKPGGKNEVPAAPRNEAKKDEPKDGAAAKNTAPGPSVTWTDVAPIFGDRCAGCHDPDDKKGGLDLTSYAAALQGGGSGRSIVPGEPEQSRLYRLVTQQERPFMPKDADPLAAAAQSRIRQWIEQGAAEDAGAARAFAQGKELAAKTAVAIDAAMTGPAPMPKDLPAVPVQAPARPLPVQSLARSPRTGLLAMPGCQQVLLFDAEIAPLGVLPCALPKVSAVAFSADGSALAVAGGQAGRSGRAAVFDVGTGRELGTFGDERDVPLAVAVHRAAGLVALGGAGKRARVWSLRDGRAVMAGKHDDFVLGLDFSPDGSLLAAGDRSGLVVVWEIDGGRQGQKLEGHKGAVDAVAFHRAGKWLATTGADGTLRLWDVAEGKQRWQQNAHKGEGLAVAFGPGDAVASCGSDGRIAVFTTAGKAVATSAAAGEWLYCVAFGADDKIVWAGDARGRLHRFDVATKKLSASVPLPPIQ